MPIRYNSIDNRIVYGKTPLTSVMKGDSTCIYGNDIGYSTIFTYIKSGGSVTIAGLTRYGKQLSIIKVPSKIERLSVTELSRNSFRDCTNLVSVTIPDSVTSIGEGAFRGCSSLESMTAPFVGAEAGKTAEDTYQYPFGYIFGTSSYNGGTAVRQTYYGSSTSSTTSTTYYIPSSLRSVTVTGGNILRGAFSGCSMLTSVTIGDSVTSIGGYAFNGCKAEIVWGDTPAITEIGEDAFAGYAGASITIPNSVTSIRDYAFSGCTSLISVTIGDSVTSIGKRAFNNCHSLERLTVALDNPVYHSAGNCIIETATKTLIQGCKGSVIPDDGSVTSLGSQAFYYCDSLTSIAIPNSVTSIGGSAFEGCYSLEAVHIADIGKWAAIGFGNEEANPLRYAGKLYLNGELVTDLVIPDSVTSIRDCAFYGCDSLLSVTIPDSVTSIGKYAFYDCDSLLSVTIPDSVTSIRDYAFDGCTSLESLTVADGNTVYHSAGNCIIETATKTLIQGCKGSVIPDDGSVTSIGSQAFYYCDSLTSIAIPNSVTSIGERAFYGCTSLASVTIENSVKTIGWYAFQNCTSLTSVIFTGTKTQWNAISKGTYWNYGCPFTEVVCSDGTVSV